jgi:signal transduction histidine kinase
MEFRIERKIEVNEWIATARWYYLAGLFIIEASTIFFSHSNVSFPFWALILIFIFAIGANAGVFAFLKFARSKPEAKGIDFIGGFQIAIDIALFLLIMHFAGGIESVAIFFLVLPVVSASLIFGVRGSVTAALFSGAAINALHLAEYSGVIPHASRYAAETIEFSNLSIALTKTFTISFFYLIVGIFSGYGSRLLFTREQLLSKHTEKLDRESKQRAKQVEQLDTTARLLVRRDLELTKINSELDKKLVELEKSEESVLKAFRDIENERNKTLAIISNLTDPIIVLDEENKINLFNHAAVDILGIHPQDLGAMVDSKNHFSIENFDHVIRHEFTFKPIEEDKKLGTIIEEMTIKRQNMPDITYKVITANVIDEDQHKLGSMKIFYDLTREKMIDQMKSEFISIAAHQLRTPLAAIKWIIKMVMDGDSGPVNAEQKEMLSKAFQSNDRIIDLVNDLLNVSRIEEGRFGYTFAMIPFTEVLDIVIGNVEKTAQDHKIKLVITKTDPVPTVWTDKSRLTMVLQNLIENSVKYTPEYGKIEIIVKTTKNNFLEVKVKDNGVGIPETDKHKLFSKFFRASNVIRMETEGTGLGLFIARNIIEKNGGRIYVQSEEGRGTEVGFTLPLQAP